MEVYLEERILKQDEGVKVVRTGDLVVKTVLGKNQGFFRFLKYDAEEMVNREIRALELLEDLDGIQKLVERKGIDKIVTRYIEGKNLGDLTKEELPSDYFGKLRDLVMQCNARGVYRVGSKQDFLISSQGNPAIIDFGSVLFEDDSLLRIPGLKKLAEYRLMSKLGRIEREFYETK